MDFIEGSNACTLPVLLGGTRGTPLTSSTSGRSSAAPLLGDELTSALACRSDGRAHSVKYLRMLNPPTHLHNMKAKTRRLSSAEKSQVVNVGHHKSTNKTDQ